MAFDLASVLGGIDVPKSGTGLEMIDIAALRGDEKNFYSVTDESVAELSANIELVGLQQPLNVRPDPEAEGCYIVVSGHRRLAALELLVSEGKKDFARVPCMVTENASEALNELRLIYGNASTRQLSNYELHTQAQRVQELFYQLKEEGVEFPGRMRDHVAEACRISKSKLSRLKVIAEKLEIFLEDWQAGKLAEATAYELAQCPAELQWRVRDSKIKPTSVSPVKLARVREAWAEGARWEMEHICSISGKVCGHGDVALRRDLAAESYQHLCKGETCCLKCSYGPKCAYGKCERMCKPAADKAAADKQRLDEASAKAEEKRKLREAEEFKRQATPYLKAAEAAGLAEDEKLLLGYVSFTPAGLREWIDRPELNNHWWVFRNPNALDVVKLADKLGCSVDFLLGRTEQLRPAAAPAAPGWISGEPEQPGRYWCKVDFCDGLEPWVEDLSWTGEKWKGLDSEAVVIGWWPLPEG